LQFGRRKFNVCRSEEIDRGIHVDGDICVNNPEFHGISPTLVEKGGSEIGAYPTWQRATRRRGHELQREHPIQSLKVLGDEDLRRIVTNDGTGNQSRHQDCGAISSDVKNPASG
jgi:hypothetical protein